MNVTEGTTLTPNETPQTEWYCSICLGHLFQDLQVVPYSFMSPAALIYLSN